MHSGCGGSSGRSRGLLKGDCGLDVGYGVNPRGISCKACNAEPRNCSGPPYGCPNHNFYPCGFSGKQNACRQKEPWQVSHLKHVWNYKVCYCNSCNCNPKPCGYHSSEGFNATTTVPCKQKEGEGNQEDPSNENVDECAKWMKMMECYDEEPKNGEAGSIEESSGKSGKGKNSIPSKDEVSTCLDKIRNYVESQADEEEEETEEKIREVELLRQMVLSSENPKKSFTGSRKSSYDEEEYPESEGFGLHEKPQSNKSRTSSKSAASKGGGSNKGSDAKSAKGSPSPHPSLTLSE